MNRVRRLTQAVLLIVVGGILATGCAPATDEMTATATKRPTIEPTPTTSSSQATPTEAGNPTVSVSPRSGEPGAQVNVTVTGFPAETMIDIGAGRVDSEYDVLTQDQTDSTGRLETQIVIPEFAEPADRWVIVAAAQGQSVKAVSEEFDVTQASAPTPSGEGGITRTDVYLIAVGDDGQSGKEVGCDDSAIPVEVQIEPTTAPLGAALGELLAIEEREYGQSGLTNALYQSSLAVESVAIEDGEAIIELSGTLSLGGVCDGPRVKAQLEETALQYGTVDKVSVFINGTPLDELLSQK